MAVGCTSLLALGLMGNSDGVAEHQGKDRTGAPGSNQPCTQCHSGGAYTLSPQVWLMDTDETTEYIAYLPGETMRLTFNVISTGMPAGYGLQATALLSDNSNAGTFINPSANGQLENVGGRHIFEHNDLSTSNTFKVDWTAPPAGSGPVTVYFATLGANGNGGTAGDSYAGGSITFEEGAATAICGPDCTALPAPTVRTGQLEWHAAQPVTLQAFNMAGQALQSWNLRPGLNALNLEELPQGALIFAADDGQVFRFLNR